MTKARGAGRPRAVLAKANRRETGQARRALGTLASLKVGPRTAKRYQLALQVLFSCVCGVGGGMMRDFWVSSWMFSKSWNIWHSLPKL